MALPPTRPRADPPTSITGGTTAAIAGAGTVTITGATITTGVIAITGTTTGVMGSRPPSQARQGN
ncbi:MAG: hypothetical protein ABSH08_11575 [Tepidisphaeraceae bacterium]